MDLDYPLRVNDVRWSPQEQPVENAEHHGVGPDAEGEGDNDHRREAGAEAEPAEGVAQVLPEDVE
jgi:hypothetical protein